MPSTIEPPPGDGLRRGPSAESREREAKALELHLAGATYADIARTIGYRHVSSARQAVQRALRLHAHKFTPDDNPADTEMARLDKLLAGLWPKARRGDVQAVDRVLQIEERRRALMEREAAKTQEDKDDAPPRTGLSDFEQRLRDREQRATDPRRADSG